MILLIALFIWWSSPRPVDTDTQRVVVTGGALTRATVALGGLSGEVWIEAPRECATIEWWGQTRDGVTLHTKRAFLDGCDKFYVPFP